MKKKIAIILSIIIMAVGSFAGCNSKAESSQMSVPSTNTTLERFSGNFFGVFDTVTFVIGFSKNEAEFTEMLNSIKAELTEYHQLYDIYNTYDGINNIKTINDSAGIAPVKVDKRIIDLLEFGVESYERTEGLTNMAMGGLLEIWHTYREEGVDNPVGAQVPPRELLEAAGANMSIENIVIDKQNSTVFITNPETSIDVGSLAKGYAVEQVARRLEEQGTHNVLLSAGGNVRAIGTRADGSLWEVGVENPYGGEEYQGVVLLENASLVISGNYQRYYTVDGVRYHHIINPKTLMPENNFAAVAILCKDSGLADALSTAAYNMTLEEGKQWVEKQDGVEAMWMLSDQQLIYSSGFEEHLRKS